MGLDLADYETKVKNAVRAFWRKRDEARRKQKKSGKTDQGERSGVTAGKNMDGFLALVKDIVQNNGLTDSDVCINRRLLTLPGYFRPTKIWDLLVMNDRRLIAAIELKSQVGPSFGKNFNNRTEEAIGSALDLWTAYREGALENIPGRSWVGSCCLKTVLGPNHWFRTPRATFKFSLNSMVRVMRIGTTSSARSLCRNICIPPPR